MPTTPLHGESRGSRAADTHADNRSSRAADTLDGRSIIVTGGSCGLGAEVARVLGQAGARIAIADIDPAQAEERAAMLCERGLQAVSLPLDAGDERQVRRAIRHVVEHHGGLHALVVTTAAEPPQPIEGLPAADWDRIVRRDLTAPFLLAKHAVSQMQPGSHIVHIVSTAARCAGPNAAASHATQWGLLGLTHALRAELRPRGIRVSAVFAGALRAPADRAPARDTPAALDAIEVANAVRFVLVQSADASIPELHVVPAAEGWPA